MVFFYSQDIHDKIFPAGKKITCTLKGINGFIKAFYTPEIDMKGIDIIHQLVKIQGANRFHKIELN